ncbi:MAG: hypothetical protein R3D97_05055 [Paracoccaceae bacterium]
MRKTRTGTGGNWPAGRSKAALSEAFAPSLSSAAAVGFVLSQLPCVASPVLWIQDRLSRKEAGRPYLPGVSILRLDLSHPRDVLIAAEEGLRCRALAAVVVEIWGDPPALGFTASKRLMLRAEAAGLPCWLIRRAATPALSAARDRWRITALPSRPNPDDPAAPGDPRWQVELMRSRDKKPGFWVATHDRAADRVGFAAAVSDGTVAEPGRTAGQRTAG